MKKLSMMLLLFVTPVLIIAHTCLQVQAEVTVGLGEFDWIQRFHTNNMGAYGTGWNVDSQELSTWVKQFIHTDGLGGIPDGDDWLDTWIYRGVSFDLQVTDEAATVYMQVHHAGDFYWQNGDGWDWTFILSALTLRVWEPGTPDTLYRVGSSVESDIGKWPDPIEHSAELSLTDYTDYVPGYVPPAYGSESVDFDGDEFDYSYYVPMTIQPGEYSISMMLESYVEVDGLRLDQGDDDSFAGIGQQLGDAATGSFLITDSLPDGAILLVAEPLNAVPLPTTVWLLGSGLIGIVGIRRKFKK